LALLDFTTLERGRPLVQAFLSATEAGFFALGTNSIIDPSATPSFRCWILLEA